MNTKLLHNSFNAGEISPELFGRPDTQQFRFGAAKARNWITRAPGSAQYRPGFATVSTLASTARLITFKDDGDDFVITIEAGRFRFFRNGLPVSLQGGTEDVYIIGNQETSGNIDLVNDVLYTTRPHGFADLEEVRVTSVGGTGEPGGTSSIFTYEARPQGPYGLQLKIGATDPVNITSLNTGTLFVWREAGLPDDYEVPTDITTLQPAGPLGHYRSGIGSFTQITFTGPGPTTWPQGTEFVWEVGGGGAAPDTSNLANPSAAIAYDGRRFRTTFTSSTVTLGANDIAAEQQNPYHPANGSGFRCCRDNVFTAPVRAARIYPAGSTLFLRAAIGAFAANAFIRAKQDVAAETAGPQTAEWEVVSAPWLELPNDYTANELNELTFAQTSDRVRIAHRNHATLELYRNADGTWAYRLPLEAAPLDLTVTVTPGRGAQLGITTTAAGPPLITTNADHGLGAGDLLYISGNASITDGFYICGAVGANTITQLMTFGGAVFAPSGVSAGGTIIVVESTAKSNHRYIITAVDENGREFARSEASDSTFNLLSNAESFNSISWATDPTAAAYRIYKEEDGTELFGFIAEAGAPPFLDRNVDPDFDTLAPEIDDELRTDYPGAVAFYDQRGAFGGNTAKPQGLWLTSLGRDNELISRRSQLDTDRIAIEIASREAQSIRHLVPLSELLTLTNSATWALQTQNTDALTPKSASIRLQTTVGASYVRPLVMNNSVLYASEAQHIHRLGYQLTENSFGGTDLSVRAAHLFDDITLLNSASTTGRLAAAWFVDSAGDLLGLTYSEEEQVAGWHKHSMNNHSFISVAAAQESGDDRLYAVTVNGTGQHYLTRQEPLNINGSMNSAHLDQCYRRLLQNEDTSTLSVQGPGRLGGELRITSTGFSFDFDMLGEVIFFPPGGFAARITERVSRSEVKAEVIDVGNGYPGGAANPGIATDWGVTVTVQRNRPQGATTEGRVTALLQPLSGLVEVHELTIVDGKVTLPFPCRALHLGEPYSNELRTMPVTAQMEAAGLGRVKAISHAYVRTYEAGGLKVGPDLDHLSTLYPDDNELHSEESRQLVEQTWTRDGQMSFVQHLPLPATIASVTLDVSFGG